MRESAVNSKPQKNSDIHDHLVGLDSLRGIAILAVVSHHMLGYWASLFGPLEIPLVGGDALKALHLMPGVPLFFLLSGYLLTWTEGKRAERGEYRLRAYAMRRALRLIPAYYMAIVGVLLLWPRPVSWLDLSSHLLFLHGVTPAYSRTMSPAFWSLTPEVVFYLLLPFVILLLPKLWQRLTLFVVLYAASWPTKLLAGAQDPTARIPYGEFVPFQFYSSFPTALLYLFIVGMLIRMLVVRLGAAEPSIWRGRVSFVLFAVCGAYIAIKPNFGITSALGLGRSALVVEGSVLTDLSLIGFFAAAVLGAPVLRHILKWRPLAFIGLVSYSMFVFHQTVLLLASSRLLQEPTFRQWVTQNETNEWLGFLVYIFGVFGVILLVAYLGYRFIESPFLRIKPK